MTSPRKDRATISIDKVRFLREGDLRKALLEAKDDHIFLIGETVFQGKATPENPNPDKVVELVWAKVFRTKG